MMMMMAVFCFSVDYHHGETEALSTVDKQFDRDESEG